MTARSEPIVLPETCSAANRAPKALHSRDKKDSRAKLTVVPEPTDFAALRNREFSRLDRSGTVYADYTGAALYPESLVAAHARRLTETVLGNPHSASGPSVESTGWVNSAKRRTLKFLQADPAEYDVIFTANATGAMRILAEAFPFECGSRLVLTADNHNSVNGLRIAAKSRGAEVAYVPLREGLASEDPRPYLRRAGAASLFAYPAQSNFSGVQHPLTWIRQAQSAGYRVLLDAAAYLPSHALSLAEFPADFVALSFYKLFGYPTGVGALVARRDGLGMLRRNYFAGGTVDFASIQNDLHRAKSGAEAFEDGTPNFAAMPAICDGLDWFAGLGLDDIEQHTELLTAQFLAGLRAMAGGVVIYGPDHVPGRGSSVAFNVRRQGRVVPFEEVEAAARAEGIAIRGGCFCNPGAAERALEIPADRARACLTQKEFSIPGLRDCLGGTAVGALRVSFGVANHAPDVTRVLSFLGRMAAARHAQRGRCK